VEQHAREGAAAEEQHAQRPERAQRGQRARRGASCQLEGWASANENQRLIWAGLREFLGTEFGCTHAYDGVVFIQGPAHYRYALFTRPDQPAVHMINSQHSELWRQVAAVPGRAPGLLAEDNAFAQMRVKASNPGWIGTTVHRLPRANPEGHGGPTWPGLVRSKSI